MQIPRTLAAIIASLFAYSFATANSEYVEISSLKELRKLATRNDQKIRLAPGRYTIKETEPGNVTVFEFSGSNNVFDFTDVTIELPTKILRDLEKTKAHGIKAYLVSGDNLQFKGGRFEDTGDHPPRISIQDFYVSGNDVTFTDCEFIVRGSAPYGMGDYLGKGRGSAVRLQKHSAMAITGDRPLIENCYFRIHTFGHGIHIHGSQDVVIRNTKVVGDQRKTDDIYASKDPLAKQFKYKIQYPSWMKGQPIPRGQVIGLTEDGIRAYTRGTDKHGNTRNTGHITVENCTVDAMRGGITLALARQATVTNSIAINCSHAFSLPSNSTVRHCKGNAAYGPLLSLPYASKSNSDIEIELLDAPHELGDHPLARITGSHHKIKIFASTELPIRKLRPIILGTTGERYTTENSDSEKLDQNNKAHGIVVTNQSPHPTVFSSYSTDCRIESKGELLLDEGTGNTFSKL
ncbi:right-handed parallel beta-helix repeat-containing protein [Pelagicoccus sp. SDUM812005]|uniref:right-handed parallel beta-helix repeat-containing protein n=1 Tax=Pelagicoccus sp. SDUM812005 TaxID=3041257 RepID=UPI002810925E|nr:right-handed parallel beta-helix repeat-containing protein [Pelagicoccus sp. SDUM812005]MDQ8181556.1 right-handed parallel beta-helix repeat-containing protein [Pelagicoccus sp. SDUM812005]